MKKPLNLGINSQSIGYEVALEILGQCRQPLLSKVREEKAKPAPSSDVISLANKRLAMLDELQDTLRPTDVDSIAHILDKNNRDAWLWR